MCKSVLANITYSYHMNCCNMRVGQHLVKTTMVNSEDIINLLQAVDQ